MIPEIYHGFLVCTFVNNGYTEFALSCLRRLRQLQVPWKLLVVAIDDEAYTIVAHEFPDQVLLMRPRENVSTRFCSWGEHDYLRVVFVKLDVIQFVLAHRDTWKYSRLVYMDTDIWVYSDFIPYLEGSHTDRGLYFQSDHPKTRPQGYVPCSGFFLINVDRADTSVFDYRSRMSRRLLRYTGDQDYLIRTLPAGTHSGLPRHLFPNGVFRNQVPAQALILHYNYLKGVVKMHHMVSRGHWIGRKVLSPVASTMLDYVRRAWPREFPGGWYFDPWGVLDVHSGLRIFTVEGTPMEDRHVHVFVLPDLREENVAELFQKVILPALQAPVDDTLRIIPNSLNSD